jgi:hypothetical protein
MRRGGEPVLCSKAARADHRRIAAIEQLGLPDASTWLVLRGRVWEGDEERLLDQALASDGDVTVDLTDVEELTIGGCWALRRLADRLWERGYRVTMLVPHDHPSRVPLERSGTIGYARIRFEGAAF